jgi:predicted Zn-dependent protease
MTEGEPKSSIYGFKHFKIALTGLAIAGVATGSFLRWQSSATHLEGLALHSMEAGDAKSAYEQLAALENKLPLPQLLLYQAYALRESDLMNRSNQRLNQAIELLEKEQALKKAQKQLLLELYLNLTLNGYLSQDQALFKQGLNKASALAENNAWVHLFQAIDAENRQEWSLAIDLAHKAQKRSYLSSWMKQPFSSAFGKYWSQLIRIRCLIETGKTVSARELISQIPPKDPSSKSEVRFLIGLSHIKEGQKQPLEISLGYFQIAYSFLKDLALEHHFDEVGQAFLDQGLKALKAELLSDLSFYIQALSHWKDHKFLEPLAMAYIEWLSDKQMTDGAPPVLSQGDAQLKTLIDSPEWQDDLLAALAKRVQVSIENKRWDLIGRFWTMTVTSAQTSPELVKAVTDIVEAEVEKRFQKLIRDVAQTDDPQILDPAFAELKQLLPLLAQIQSDERRYQIFLQKLADEATLLIQAPKISPASDEVFGMLLNSTSAPQPERIRLMLKDKLAKRFWQARNMQDMAGMSVLFDICVKVGIDAIPSYAPDAIANMVADSKFMLENDKVNQAREQLGWVLKIDPKNQQARLLLGSSYFHSGDYAKAGQLLEQVQNPTKQIRQLLAISYLRSGQVEKALDIVSQIQKQGEPISDRLCFETAILKANQNQWQESLNLLESIRQKNADVWIYILAAQYKLSNAKGVWQAYSQLPALMKANRSLTSLALRSAQKIELWGLADSILEKALNVAPNQAIISQNATEFLKKNFQEHELDISLAASQYFQESKQNPQRALEILEGKDGSDWRVLVERAKALIQIGSYPEAYEELAKAPAQLPMDKEHLGFWVLKSQAARLQGSLDESWQLLESLEKQIQGPSRLLALEKAWLMIESKRMDVAIKLLEPQLSAEATFDEIYLLVQALIQQGEFEKGLHWASLASHKDMSAWANWRLATTLWPAAEHQETALQIPSKNLFEILTGEQKAIMLQKMMNMGAFARAQSWGQTYVNDLGDSFEAFMARMQLCLLQRQMKEAHSILEKMSQDASLSLNQLMRLLDWLEVLGEDRLLRQMVDRVPSPSKAQTLSQSARYASFLVYLSFAKVMQDKYGIMDENLTQQIITIRNSSQLTRKEEGPLYDFWIHASACMVLADTIKAEPDLRKCQSACESFVKPYFETALILKQAGSMPLAVQSLKDALKLNPEHPWIELAIAELELEMAQPKGKPTNLELLAQASRTLERSLEKAPYLSQGHLLAARIAACQQKWVEAYEEIMIADQIKPGDQDILRFLEAILTKRMEIEGSRLEWTQKLTELQRQLKVR